MVMSNFGKIPSGNDCCSLLLKPWPSQNFASFPIRFLKVDLSIVLNYQRVQDGAPPSYKLVYNPIDYRYIYHKS